jgi:tetratricopeptide (TPR) repeat protein
MDEISYEDKEKQVNDYIKKGEEFEKINKHQGAIENYEKALDVLGNIDIEKSFKLNMKLGELYRNIGDMDNCIEYFHISYNIAVKLDNIYFKIDSLNKLAIENFSKGEINTSLIYINKSSDLLKEVDYTEGKLNNLIYWLFKYFYENELYKVREIGNGALKLCGEDYPFYKGKILNILAQSFTEITNANEHLHLLHLSLENFEKAGFTQGILGVTSNIGGIYTDKLQDNEKALQFYAKLREKANKENFDEFSILSYINTGEVSLRCLRYENAYLSFKNGLEEAKKANLDHMRFYAYIGLVNTCTKLEKYNEAYKYFKLAKEEFCRNPEQGPTIPLYYKVTSLFYYILGDIDNAKKDIKKSLQLLSIDSVIKWNTGLIYEFIRLRDAKSNSEANDAIEGLKCLLRKYKSKELIMDNIYNASIQLIDKGYEDDAARLMDQFKEAKVKPNIKSLYIEAYIKDINNEKNLDGLNKLQILAEKTGGSFLWRIYYLIGNFYNKQKKYNKAMEYYNKALDEANHLANNVPEEYRDKFIQNYNLDKPKNKMRRDE